MLSIEEKHIQRLVNYEARLVTKNIKLSVISVLPSVFIKFEKKIDIFKLHYFNETAQ
jgi:hypothetical protein